mgnify:CR=1 FL=1
MRMFMWFNANTVKCNGRKILTTTKTVNLHMKHETITRLKKHECRRPLSIEFSFLLHGKIWAQVSQLLILNYGVNDLRSTAC